MVGDHAAYGHGLRVWWWWFRSVLVPGGLFFLITSSGQDQYRRLLGDFPQVGGHSLAAVLRVCVWPLVLRGTPT